MATVEEIRKERIWLHGLIADRSQRKSMFGNEEQFAGQIEKAQQELVVLQTVTCCHEARVGGLCPDCGSLLENAGVMIQLEAAQQALNDALTWLNDDEMFNRAYPKSKKR